jgi:hypothetical protein
MFFSLLALASIAILLILAFEVWMFVDVIRNPKLESTDKLLWCIGMLIFHPIVAIVYYFVVYAKRGQ